MNLSPYIYFFSCVLEGQIHFKKHIIETNLFYIHLFISPTKPVFILHVYNFYHKTLIKHNLIINNNNFVFR